jgi:hypothetical protein
MHSSLAVTADGLPLGLTAIKFWSRSKFKGTKALKRPVNPTRVPIEQKESIRWLENLKRSCLGSLRDECLNASWFWNLWDARRKITAWRQEYNHRRLIVLRGSWIIIDYASPEWRERSHWPSRSRSI